ncbi:hypothetical protein ACFVX6_40375 [Streptomyces sp. NPDC058289]|uniref:hypothetical protein n=1 Tax=Streptomyces sp. NPDC058289 TaxID=3346425 RepID=UPI0036E6CD9E
MSGIHARPTSALFRSVPDVDAAPAAHAARQGRRGGFVRRLRRRLLAYRDIQFCSTRIPGDGAGVEEDCLLLVHVRKVVGQIHYRTCPTCGEGVITGIDIDNHLLATGIGTRALSHLHSRHPGITWRSTLTLRTTRDLLRRMRIPVGTAGALCAHARTREAAEVQES